MEENPIELCPNTNVFLSLENLFKGLPINLKYQENNNPPAGLPFLVTLSENEESLQGVNVLEVWGKDYE